MRNVILLLSAGLALGACTDDGRLSGDDPNRNNEGPGEGRPMDSNPSARQPTNEVTLDKQRPYADDNATEQTTAAPPDSKQ